MQKCGVNVMYQTTLNDNPQQGVQGLQHLFRRGQTQEDIFLYHIMVDCYTEKVKLQRQVEKAGGWRQRLFNPGNACDMLDIPESWLRDEPTQTDKAIWEETEAPSTNTNASEQ